MLDTENNAKCQTEPLTFKGRSPGQELDMFLSDCKADIQSLVLGERMAITVVGQNGSDVTTYCLEAYRDTNGVVEANVLAAEIPESDASAATKLYDQLKGGLWDWPVTEEPAVGA